MLISLRFICEANFILTYMNMNSHFNIFVANPTLSFADQLQDLRNSVQLWFGSYNCSPSNLLFSRVYLTDSANQLSFFLSHSLFSDCLSFGAISYVEQPLIGGAKVAVQAWIVDAGSILKKGTPEKMEIKIGDSVIFFFQSVRFKELEVDGKNACVQTEMAFQRHIDWLEENGLRLKNNCHRTWLYVRDVDRNYADVVRGRNNVFENEGLTKDTHFIASTGIGGASEDCHALVGVDFFSVDGISSDGIRYLQALDFLNPTSEYGVAFERGTALDLPFGHFRFISGTASIDKYGICLYRGDIQAQTERMFLNVSKLLEADGSTLSDIAYMVVYLRDIADYMWVKKYLSLHFPDVPSLLVEARVCRPEWLIEVECIAVTHNEE